MKIPWKRNWKPTPIFLSGKSHRQRILQATVHGVIKSWTQLSDWTPTNKKTESEGVYMFVSVYMHVCVYIYIYMYIYIYIKLNHCVVYLILTKHCKINYILIKNFRRTRWQRSRCMWHTYLFTDTSEICLQTQKCMQNTSWEQIRVPDQCKIIHRTM